MKPLIHQLDKAIMSAVSLLPAGLEMFFVIITTLGSPFSTAAIGLGIISLGHFKQNLRLSFAGFSIWLTLACDSLLKIIIGRARPATKYAESMIIQTNSFPSGHSAGSMVAYGLLAYLAWNLLPRPWSYVVVLILAGLIILIGISRIYLGAHFPTDVIAGWILGAIVLILVILWNPLR